MTQDIRGSHFVWTGNPAEIRDDRLIFRADTIDYDKDTGDLIAIGHVYYRNLVRQTEIWASRVEYNTEEEKGKFYEIHGTTHPRIVARPGVLTVDAPYYFEGEWAERIGEKYVVHNGWGTNCKVPKPWWKLRSRTLDVVPEEHAIAHRSYFLLRGIPLFYTPFFYHSLHKEPRKSGFLAPNIVPHSQRGFMLGIGYYWAINRSYDLSYVFHDYTSNAFGHQFDFRAKPRPGTDFSAAVYGVQDRSGDPDSGDPPQKYSGASVYAVGHSDLGHGFTARGYGNYISSFRFRSKWSQDFFESIGSEIQAVGVVERKWREYTLDITFARLQNFESLEVPATDPSGVVTGYTPNVVTIRKLPDVEFSGRDRPIFRNIPLWFSFDTDAGLMYRAEPIFQTDPITGVQTLLTSYQTGPFTPRVHLFPHLTGALQWGPVHIVPSIGVEESYYGEAQGPDAAHPGLYRIIGTNLVRSARDLSVDIVLPSFARVFDKKTIFGDKLKHVIEPRATYRYVTGIGEDFNRFIRFDDKDLLSNTNELEWSLTNRLYAKHGDSVEEVFTWELMQKRYFDPTFGGALIPGVRNLFEATADISAFAFLVTPRNTSPVASLLRFGPMNGLGIQWQADYDPRVRAIIDSAVRLDYRWKKYVVYAANYEAHINDEHYVDPKLMPSANQFTFGASVGDANRRGWNGRGDFFYDYRQGFTQWLQGQVTYNTDCCGFSVQFRRFGIRNETQWRFAFAVANLGSFGTLRKQERVF